MVRNGLLTLVICLSIFNLHTVFCQTCWSTNACIDVAECAAKGGTSQAGICPGADNIQCCSCSTCMDTAACSANGRIFYSDICSDPSNIQCCKSESLPVVVPSEPVNTMLTDLADILRGAGLNVVEETGWKTRGHDVMSSVKGILVHHTAGPATGEYPSLRIVRDGRPDLPGPLSQLGLGRSGTWYVIAAGKSYHAGKTINDTIFGNANAIGIEAEGTGLPEDNIGHENWPEVQWQSYVHGVKALQAAYGVPTSNVLGHKEAAVPAGRKIDPNFSMDEFRAALN